jgi:hypothetical protein
VSLHLASAADLLRRPDGVKAGFTWTASPARSSVGGLSTARTLETDEDLDKLILLRAWTARRLVN